jgi:hypothetical protein
MSKDIPMPSAKQGPYVGRVEAVLSSSRLGRFAASASEPKWEYLARYAWNVALCEAFYPSLHHLEVVLRNRVYEFGKTAYPYRHFHHIDCWLDADPWHLHPYGQLDVQKAKRKLFGIDKTGALRPLSRPYAGGDLVAALDFGFWTGLFSNYYLFQRSSDKRLWPHGLGRIFPNSPVSPTLAKISGRLNDVRQLRNRIFHHEPIWRRNLRADYANIIELLDWMSPEVAHALRGVERLPQVLSDDYRRRLRVHIHRESRR